LNKLTASIFIFIITGFSLTMSGYESNQNVFDEAGVKGLPVFNYNIFRTLTGDEGNFVLNIHVEISNDRLQFLKKDSVYYASYSLSAAVFEGAETGDIPLFQESVIKNVSTKEYKETQSGRTGKSHSLRFDVKSGVYTVAIVLKDLNTNKKHTVRKSLEYVEKTDPIISDLRMVYWTDDNDFENSYTSLINNVVDKQSSYTGALFEIFSAKNPASEFSLRYRILNSSGDIVFDDRYKNSTKDRLQLQVLKIPLDKLGAGNYRIEMEIEINGKKIQRSTVFYLRWKDLSLNVTDINTAVEQMLYINDFDSIDHVFSMKEEEKKIWFKKYWNDLEQSLGLKSNSLMDEYFRRTAYADVHFSVPQKSGWKTDMGKVLCVMGDPDEIQSYPFAKNQKPYEVWIYYDIGVQYIFDYLGGEYRLRK